MFFKKEVLPNITIENENFNIKEVIKNFNIINGQWLLNLMSNGREKNKNYLREKLSLISAYKTLLGILKHDNFVWIPISLEEILRVSRMLGLKSSDGLFSSKNLGHSGPTSDDLLFIGIERIEKEGRKDVFIHFLPIEVKVGQNKNVDNKAINQVVHTAEILNEYLSKNNKDEFIRKYYLNFFISIAMSNLEKMIASKFDSVIDKEEYHLLKDRLATGNYKASNKLEEIYGKGIVYKFTTNHSIRTMKMNQQDKICEINVPESDAYRTVSDPIKALIEKIQNRKYDFPDKMMLVNRYNYGENKGNNIEEEENTSNDGIEKNQVEIENNEIEDNNITLNETRLLIGKHKYSNKNIYWEYGNKGLSNRHVIITGKSGQGKTYFIQTLLSELSMSNINILIIDYTDGYLENQIEDIFKENFKDKLKTKIIYRDKLPINPFKKIIITIGDEEVLENNENMIDRVVQSIDFVFGLGVQQTTLLAEVLKEDINIHGEKYTFTMLMNNLNNYEDKAKFNLYGRIRTLVEQERFSYDSHFNWDNIFANNGEIHIFQFAGVQKNIQQVMIEFLLWDIFQYAKSGNELKPLPIVLDEIQNLRFTSDSPLVKILREGRKYGLSGIFATQSLASIKGSDKEAIFNSAQQIHFLPPDNQIADISKIVTSDRGERNNVETELKNLKKGEAVVYGPILDSERKLTSPELHYVKIKSFENRSHKDL